MNEWRGLRTTSARVRTYLRAAPGTLIYLFTLFVTQLTLGTVDDRLGQRLLLSESTNLHNMARVPLQVLIGSAFWFDTDTTLTTVTFVLLLLVLAPVERWLGTGRWLLAVASGHVGATLITLVATVYAVRHGLLAAGPASLTRAMDVGVSYVLLTAVGVFCYRLPRVSLRLAWALALVGSLGTVLWLGHGVADLGHLCAFLIGLGCYPLVAIRRRGRARATASDESEPSDGPEPTSAPAATPITVAAGNGSPRQLAVPAVPAAQPTSEPPPHT